MLSERPQTAFGRVLRVAFGALLIATCLRVWLGPVTELPRAQAQIPDAGSQRRELLREVQRTNTLLGQMLKTLQTQTFKVQMQGTDNKRGSSPRPAQTTKE